MVFWMPFICRLQVTPVFFFLDRMGRIKSSRKLLEIIEPVALSSIALMELFLISVMKKQTNRFKLLAYLPLIIYSRLDRYLQRPEIITPLQDGIKMKPLNKLPTLIMMF